MGWHPSPRYGQVKLVRRYPVLSIDHSIDVQYESNISFPVLPNSLDSVRLNIGFPALWCGGREGCVGSRDYQIFWDG